MRIAAAFTIGVLAAGLVAAAPIADEVPVTDTGVCDPLDPAHCLLPWPSDHFTVEDATTDTGRRLALDLRAMPRNVAGKPIDPIDWNRNDGFSPGQMIVTKVPGLDTPEALAATDPVGLTDLSRYAEEDAPVVVLNAATGERHPIWVELDSNASTADDRLLIIRPAVNFDEGARYIVALRGLRDASGQLLEAGPAFREFRDAKWAKGPGHTDGRGGNDRPEATGRAAEFEAIFATLEDAGIEREDLYLAWDFTVASERNLSERMLFLRDDAFAQLGDTTMADLTVQGSAPTFVVDEITQQLPCRPTVDIDVPPVDCEEQEALDPRLARRIEGRVIVPCYLDQPGCPTGSKFAYAGLDATLPTPIPGNVAVAPFVCNIPKAEWLPEDGFRPSLYGHGLLGTADQVNSGKLYDLGAHGLMFCATDWWGMASEDIGTAATILADVSRMPALADRGQQGMLNFLFLGRAMIHEQGFCSHPAFQLAANCAIDTSRLYYNGGSQGGIMGGSLTAVAPDFTQAHLGVPGMNYSTLLRRSVDFDPFAVIFEAAYPDELEQPIILSLIQILWDRAESNGYAHHMTTDPYPDTPPHEVLLNVAFGDHQVTNWATDVMARTVGAALREPALDPGRHPAGEQAYWGIDRIGVWPWTGSAMVVGDVGPLRTEDGEVKGTTPPPLANVPNDEGVDPHGPDGSETDWGKAMIGEFLSPFGAITDHCGIRPCYLDGWQGP